MTGPSPSGPLAGLQVVEFGRFVTAPYTARVLGDLGADVIKVEGPDGDPFRTFAGDVELSPHFTALNRNKRSITINLKDAADLELFRKIVLSADVFIENSRPGSMARLGLSYADLKEANPRLVYCSITGSGQSGPYEGRPAYDMVGQAMSGLAHSVLDPDSLLVTGTNTSDSVTGLTAAIAILAAVSHRERTGDGQHIDVDMLSSSLSFMGAEAQIFLDTARVPSPTTRAANSLSFALRCSDGGAVGLHLSSVPKFWEALTQVIQRPDLLDDPRFATRSIRSANYFALRDELQKEFIKRSRDQWIDELVEADVPAAAIVAFDEVTEDPQVQHMQLIQEMTHPELGTMRTVVAPHRFSEFPTLPLVAPPRLGADRVEIIAELRPAPPSSRSSSDSA